MTSKHVASAFESDLLVLPLASLLPLKQVTDVIKKSEKYLAIAASISEIGVIEPLVVFRKPDRRGRYLLLDGGPEARSSYRVRGRRGRVSAGNRR